MAERQVVWRTKRALVGTLGILVWVPGCLIAAWWQVHVALAGNDLAYLYSVEWPVFAIFGVVVWWLWLHDDPNEVGRRLFRRLRAEHDSSRESPITRDRALEDPELRAYNDYLASLAAQGQEKTWRRQRATASRDDGSAPNTS